MLLLHKSSHINELTDGQIDGQQIDEWFKVQASNAAYITAALMANSMRIS